MALEWAGERRPKTNRHIDATLAAINEVLGDCGHDMGDDPHDADELGETQVCPDCCPTCNSISEAPLTSEAPVRRIPSAGAAEGGGSRTRPASAAGDAEQPGAAAGVPATFSTTAKNSARSSGNCSGA